MGLFDRILGDAPRTPATSTPTEDEQAIARYRYMLRTAPPEAIEQAHAEAFARLTPEQRRTVLEQLRDAAPDAEKAAFKPVVSDPQELARYATRAEIRQPGTLERAFGAMPASGGLGFGGILASSLLGSIAGTVLGTAIGQHFFEQHPHADFGAFEHPQIDGFPDDGSFQEAADDGGSFDGFDAGGDTFDV